MDDNPREVYERETDRMTLWARVLYKYGVPSAIALFLVFIIASQLVKAVGDIQATLIKVQQSIHDHAYQTNYYMRATCINTAIQAGQSASLCEPPPQDK
jgi:preprotein translocase subunit SecY